MAGGGGRLLVKWEGWGWEPASLCQVAPWAPPADPTAILGSGVL